MCSIFGVLDIKTDAVELRKKALELFPPDAPPWAGLVRRLRQR
ncbi:Asparagine synthetase B [glutamine-hydrolyzing] [Raoultella terrigena]|uniref:Asparagine synthetase B [glutamine-hydrolyzing] n=1 Tax=Raoultella terrigena TaxID=577 RepID=A0A3P8J3L3_RAOTE|nr:Asparagine synthetase B [glutamine-hydrolyzing] [Raoultella terrigena]